ncbi:MAG: hypothetical protein EOR78_33015 [Mesorhizobium sp.]|nr:MAG: hypothetical protein EOR49_30460 [Mesorhizobium sp.]RWM44509.1 MAG: hypothetical protein EOR76_24275 [Mesorhizobium sp.]RWM46153.1 MAG: hypothetical protein EOR78_33015 [Mesorhizobium sp.]RWM48211.1 MAG: hypothetical protein EOR79_32870 [Mesorhizobium sp.]RWM89558.1 MAG: hypothetical protein EOR85_32530 [Mesorhizobium sp.]
MGGDRPSRRVSPICNGARERGAPKLLISPQVGEMAGRPEGGAVPPAYPRISPELQPLSESLLVPPNHHSTPATTKPRSAPPPPRRSTARA